MTVAPDLRGLEGREFALWWTAVLFGLALLGYGLVGQLLTAGAPRWGNPDWEVAYFGEFSATLSLVAMGLTLVAGAGVTAGRKAVNFVLAAGMLLLGAWALLGAVLVTLDLPLVYEAARSAGTLNQAIGLKVVTVKAIALCGLYAVGFIGVAGYTLRTSFKKER